MSAELTPPEHGGPFPPCNLTTVAFWRLIGKSALSWCDEMTRVTLPLVSVCDPAERLARSEKTTLVVPAGQLVSFSRTFVGVTSCVPDGPQAAPWQKMAA